MSGDQSRDLKIPIAPNAAISSSRNKVALKPGYSLMDWVRLTKSGKDLAGTGGKILNVSPRELSKHKSRKDAWTCIRGKVYNITPYIDFHPGGEEELMRGAGRDATTLFNEVHQWVNVENMLQHCFVGILQKSWNFEVPKFPPLKALKSGRKQHANGSNNVSSSKTNESDEKEKSLSPVEQTDAINVKDLKISPTEPSHEEKESINKPPEKSKLSESPVEEDMDASIGAERIGDIIKLNITYSSAVIQGFLVFLVEKKLYIKIAGSLIYFLHELPAFCEDHFLVNHEGKSIEVVLKIDSEKQKNDASAALLHDGFWTLCRSQPGSSFFSCTLVKKTVVNYNTYLFTYQLPPGHKMRVPIGWHVLMQAFFDGHCITRSYTPVISSLRDQESDGREVTFMIKIYPKGLMTSMIGQCIIGDPMLISNYSGSFSEDNLRNCDSAIMLAAGTGITPMIRIIHWIVNATDKKRMALLMFFNKTENDILWRKELECCRIENKNFNVIHVLSEPSDLWDGLSGQLSEDHLGHIHSEKFPETHKKIFICGPYQFTGAALRLLKAGGYKEENIYAFLGS